MPPKKKVLHITQAMGGIKTYLSQALTYADHENFDYIAIIPLEREFMKFCKKNNVKYHIVNSKRKINLADIAVFIKVLRILRQEKPDIIHCHSAKGGFLGRVCNRFVSKKAKVIYTPNAFAHLSFTGIKRMVFYMLEYFTKKWTDLLLAVSYSEANRAYFEFGYPYNTVKVVLNSVIINPALKRQDYTNGLRISTISRLSHQKNPMLFVQMAKIIISHYPNAVFNILGAGMLDTLRQDVELYIAQNNLGNNINIYNWGNQAVSQNILQDTDVFVMTSSFEGLPFSLLEAMALGIPCVASKADGNSDVIQNNENGFACLSAAEFADRIMCLMQSEEVRRNIGMAGFNYVLKHHNSMINMRCINDIYSNILKTA